MTADPRRVAAARAVLEQLGVTVDDLHSDSDRSERLPPFRNTCRG